MTAHPTTSAVAAEAVVNPDGTGTWMISDGATEQISAATAAAACDEVAHRTVVAAAERRTVIELTATLAGVPTHLRVSPTGEITRFEVSGIAMAPASAPEADLESETAARRSVRLRWAISAAVGALAASAVTGVVLTRGAESSPLSPSMALATRNAASTPTVSPSPSEIGPVVVQRTIDVTVTAPEGGPLTAHVRVTAAPTVATLTIWHGGSRVATRRLHLPDAGATWSSRTVRFPHTRPGRYRWAATAPGAAEVTGTYQVLATPATPAPPDRRAQSSSGPVTTEVTPPPTQAPPSSTPSPPPATTQPSSTPSSNPPPPAKTGQQASHHGPVPGGDTSPPHTGPRP